MLKLVSCTAAHSPSKKKNRKEAGVHWLIRDLKQGERWRPGRHKCQTEVDIFSLSVLWLDKFLQIRRMIWDIELPVAIHDVRDVSVLVA